VTAIRAGDTDDNHKTDSQPSFVPPRLGVSVEDHYNCLMSSKLKTYICFLRGINVGGHMLLPMNELRTLCEKLGFERVRTYIQSGNIVLETPLAEAALGKQLESALQEKMGKRIPVALRTIDELDAVLKNNPFQKAEPAKVGVMFFAEPIREYFLDGVSTSTGEEVKMGKREVYIYYPNGMGRSKLKLPKEAAQGTVRNINTVRKLIEFCKG
jgi:uncharacterized protein (DUF1697 family)